MLNPHMLLTPLNSQRINDGGRDLSVLSSSYSAEMKPCLMPSLHYKLTSEHQHPQKLQVNCVSQFVLFD